MTPPPHIAPARGGDNTMEERVAVTMKGGDQTAREIIEVLAEQADKAEAGGGWSYLLLQRMAQCAQRLIAQERALLTNPESKSKGGDRG